MRRTIPLLLMAAVATSAGTAQGQSVPIQIPTLQVCNPTKVSGEGTVKIDSRAATGFAGAFTFKVSLACEKALITGSLTIGRISMTDTDAGIARITVMPIEQLTSGGKHTPTAFFSGRCTVDDKSGFKAWVMIADNKKAGDHGTHDVVGFLIVDATGRRVAYGTGPLIEGDVVVASAN